MAVFAAAGCRKGTEPDPPPTATTRPATQPATSPADLDRLEWTHPANGVRYRVDRRQVARLKVDLLLAMLTDRETVSTRRKAFKSIARAVLDPTDNTPADRLQRVAESHGPDQARHLL